MKPSTETLIDNFNRTIDTWIEELDRYDFATLCKRPSSQRWSLGQIYTHLLNETRFYIGEIRRCSATDENAMEAPSPTGKMMLWNDDFPDEALDGPATNSTMPQPTSKDQLVNDLLMVRVEMNEAYLLLSESVYEGKTKHPGLDYFSAEDWLQFAEMHLRHHFRQKKRVDDFLRNMEKRS
jgi:hypothetical protein